MTSPRLDPSSVCSEILVANSPHQILSVSGLHVDVNSDANQIRKAYLRLVSLVHPDKVQDNNARDAFQKLSWAYRYILDPGSLSSADGWQEDDNYKVYRAYKGQWYQDIDGTWYTDWDYKDEEGNWRQRSHEEVEVLQRVRAFGLSSLVTAEDMIIFERLQRQIDTAADRVKLHSHKITPKRSNSDSSSPSSPISDRVLPNGNQAPIPITFADHPVEPSKVIFTPRDAHLNNGSHQTPQQQIIHNFGAYMSESKYKFWNNTISSQSSLTQQRPTRPIEIKSSLDKLTSQQEAETHMESVLLEEAKRRQEIEISKMMAKEKTRVQDEQKILSRREKLSNYYTHIERLQELQKLKAQSRPDPISPPLTLIPDSCSTLSSIPGSPFDQELTSAISPRIDSSSIIFFNNDGFDYFVPPHSVNMNPT